MNGPLRAVLFDLWGTLVADAPDASRARHDLRLRRLHDELAAFGVRRPDEELEAALAAAGAEHELLHRSERDLSMRGRTVAYVREIDDTLASRLDEDGWRRMDAAILAPALDHPPDAMPGARETLAAVRAHGLATGLISNTGITPGAVLREILARMELLELLDVTVFSDEAELAKPAPAIFEGALAELGIDPAAAAFVGDQPRLDVLGARRAGMWAVQVGDLAEDGLPAPHARIASLDGLLPALRTLNLLR